MMYRIGVIDDTDELLDDYAKRLRREKIELLIAPQGSMEEIVTWVVRNQVKCLLIDHQLSSKYDYNGTQLAFYLDDALPGFQYLILTSYPEDSVDEKLVAKHAICDRNIMDRNEEEFLGFCEALKQMTEVFDNTIKKYKLKYEELMTKKRIEVLTVDEEEALMEVFHILKAYGEVDDVPAEMLKSSLSGQIDSILGKLDDLLKK